MKHLDDTQLNQSGTAKAYDGDEVNTIIYAFAEIIASIANNSAYYINRLRYKNLISNEEQLNKMLPQIPVPEKFDIVNFNLLLSELQSAKTAGLNSTMMSELQKELANKKFYANPEVKDFVQMVMELDPFPEKTIEEKALLEGQGLVTKQDIVLSNYITEFIQQALEEDKNFAKLTRARKKRSC
jgi:hypothetical protein